MTNPAIKGPITKIEYSFKDASVPPQYHRSYKITITGDRLHLIVDSYGDILVDRITNIPEQIIDDLVKYIKQYRIEERYHKSVMSTITGTTSKSLILYSGKDIILKGVVHQIKGRYEGSLSGDIDSFTQKIERTIPDFTDLLK